MTPLLDVNVLIAIAWPEHTFHAVAVEWFDRIADGGWASCAITELGFIRISSNPKVVADSVRPVDAVGLLRELTTVGRHEFWADDVSPSSSELFPGDRLIGHRQVTDAQLSALANRHGGSLATFDRGIETMVRGLEGFTTVIVGG